MELLFLMRAQVVSKFCNSFDLLAHSPPHTPGFAPVQYVRFSFSSRAFPRRSRSTRDTRDGRELHISCSSSQVRTALEWSEGSISQRLTRTCSATLSAPRCQRAAAAARRRAGTGTPPPSHSLAARARQRSSAAATPRWKLRRTPRHAASAARLGAEAAEAAAAVGAARRRAAQGARAANRA